MLKEFDFLQNQVINGMLMWFLDLLGLLYHSTVDRKCILADVILPAAHTVDQPLCAKTLLYVAS